MNGMVKKMNGWMELIGVCGGRKWELYIISLIWTACVVFVENEWCGMAWE